MVHTPKVSVVVSTYNRAWCLSAAIESILNQTFRDFELIVIDDGSTDETKKVLSQFQDSRMNCFFETHEGASPARNKGIQKATGEYVAFLDSDDLWFPDSLERRVSFLDRHSEIGFVHGSVEMMDSEGLFLSEETSNVQKFYAKMQKRSQDYNGLSKDAVIFSSAVLFRKSCLDQAGYLDTNLEERQDLDLYLRIALQGAGFDFLPGKPVARYCYRTSGYKDPLYLRAYIKVFEKHLALLRAEGYLRKYREAVSNFLFHMGMCYYALGELGKCREISLKLIYFNPQYLFDLQFVKHLLASFAPASAVISVRELKNRFFDGMLRKN